MHCDQFLFWLVKSREQQINPYTYLSNYIDAEFQMPAAAVKSCLFIWHLYLTVNTQTVHLVTNVCQIQFVKFEIIIFSKIFFLEKNLTLFLLLY